MKRISRDNPGRKHKRPRTNPEPNSSGRPGERTALGSSNSPISRVRRSGELGRAGREELPRPTGDFSFNYLTDLLRAC